MGAGQSCTNVSFSRNRLCDIGSCVKEVKGIVNKSSSNSDIMFLKMKNGTSYESRYIPDGKELTLKLFLDPDGDDIVNETVRPMNLIYESEIYEKIIAPMVYYGINPHFVKYYGRALGCSVNNVVDIVEAGTNLSYENALHNVIRNSIFMSRGFRGSPSITGPYTKNVNDDGIYEFIMQSVDYVLATKNVDSMDNIYGMMLTESSSGRSFQDDINELEYSGKMVKSTWISFIQILSALDALSLFECSHSDLHLGNIFIDDKPYDWVRYTYFNGEKNVTFKLKSNKTVSLFDWDRSYSKYVGNNEELSNNLYAKFQQSNEYISQRDMLKVMVYISHYCKDNERELFDLAFTKKHSRDIFESKILSNPNKFFLADKNFKSMSFDNIKTPGQMLFDVLRHVQVKGILSESDLVIEVAPPSDDIDTYNSSIDEETIRSFVSYSEWEIARDEGEENLPMEF
jgi:hypothetical protein